MTSHAHTTFLSSLGLFWNIFSQMSAVSKMPPRRHKNIAVLFASSLAVLYTSCDTIADAYVLSLLSSKTTTNTNGERKTNTLWPKLVVAAAFFTLPVVEPAFASSETAAQIQLNSVPPSTVQLQIGDLPVIGNLLSGTYARIDPGAAAAVGRALGGDGESAYKAASMIVKSPSDKVAAIKDLATTGHLEFDVNGILNTHLDVDVSTPNSGELIIKVKSPLLRKLPFKAKD